MASKLARTGSAIAAQQVWRIQLKNGCPWLQHLRACQRQRLAKLGERGAQLREARRDRAVRHLQVGRQAVQALRGRRLTALQRLNRRNTRGAPTAPAPYTRMDTSMRLQA